MRYKILNSDLSKDLIQRLFEIRNINDDIEDFLKPSFKKYWYNPFDLNDMSKAVEKILSTIKAWKRIMIFGDYDVDWITSSFILYNFITKYLKYNNISVMFPDRIEDWYWLRNKHLDIMKQKNIDLVITVDNGITSVQEALYAKELWIDLIITDHHELADQVPQAFAVINPKISSNYPFKNLCWAWVVYKLLYALLSKTNYDKNARSDIFLEFLPFVAIATVADVVPLVDENRLIVYKGLKIINEQQNLNSNLSGFLSFLNLKKIDTFHIWFVIWPRINAGWRIASPYDSFYSLLYNWDKQKEKLEFLNTLNEQRKSLQEKALKKALKQVDENKKLIFVADEEFHEWIVWIVAWRLTEKYYKPSIVLKIDKEKWLVWWSLRWPDYFDVMQMIKSVQDILVKSWWHKQAWWLTIKYEDLDLLKQRLEEFCEKNITDQDLERVINIDTYLLENEREENILQKIWNLWPYWEWNPEPLFCLKNCKILECKKIWQKWKWHLKFKVLFWNQNIPVILRSNWDKLEKYSCMIDNIVDIYWKIKKFDEERFVDCIWIESK